MGRYELEMNDGSQAGRKLLPGKPVILRWWAQRLGTELRKKQINADQMPAETHASR